MLQGESALLVVAVLVMLGAARKITARLGLNDYVTTFFIFVIVLLNVRGGIPLSKGYSLSLGGVLSVVVVLYVMISRSERASDILAAIISSIGSAGIAFVYTLHFSDILDPRLLATLLSILIGLWSAVTGKRTFASCLYSSITGSFIGITMFALLFKNGGNIGGSYAFSVMWLSAVFGILLQYLFTMTLRTIKSPRANSYFEAGELMEQEDNNRKNDEK